MPPGLHDQNRHISDLAWKVDSMYTILESSRQQAEALTKIADSVAVPILTWCSCQPVPVKTQAVEEAGATECPGTPKCRTSQPEPELSPQVVHDITAVSGQDQAADSDQAADKTIDENQVDETTDKNQIANETIDEDQDDETTDKDLTANGNIDKNQAASEISGGSRADDSIDEDQDANETLGNDQADETNDEDQVAKETERSQLNDAATERLIKILRTHVVEDSEDERLLAQYTADCNDCNDFESTSESEGTSEEG